MASEDVRLDEAAVTVMRLHGGDAMDFAKDRLAFCKATDYQEGIAMWQGIVDRIAIASPP